MSGEFLKILSDELLKYRMRHWRPEEILQDIKGGLHIFRKTFATQMYEKGARVEEIAAYIWRSGIYDTEILYRDMLKAGNRWRSQTDREVAGNGRNAEEKWLQGYGLMY